MTPAWLQDAALASAQIRQRALEVLARKEFQPETESILQLVLRKVLSLLTRWGVGPNAADFLVVILPVFAGLLLGLLLVYFLRAWVPRPARERAARRALGVEELSTRVEVRVSELLERARAAARRGDLPLALRMYAFALLVGLSERGDLEYRDSWTNRELLERGKPSATVLATLGPLVDQLDALCFSARPVKSADVESIAELCRRWIEGRAPGAEAPAGSR
jgi:hypothetical protein